MKTAPRASPHPWVWAVLYFPFGLAFGFPSVALGYLGARAGLGVSAIAGIVGMTFLASGWKFVWAPLGDYTLSRKRWYLIAVSLVAVGLIVLTAVPLARATLPLVSLLVLAASVAATFVAFATEGLMAHNTPRDMRGRAAGWFQSGNQFGQTAGGGIALWLIERSRAGRLALILAILPIGTGAAEFLFGAIGSEFHASADVVSAVLGLGGGLAIVAGCFAGGRLADRVPKRTAYAVSCGLGLVACVVIAWSPRTEVGYAASTLFYTFTLGMVTASLTGMVLAIIGEGAAATKINLFFALNTLFSLGMLRAAGWAHDAWSTNGMLYTEALTGAVALVLFVALARRVRGAEAGGGA